MHCRPAQFSEKYGILSSNICMYSWAAWNQQRYVRDACFWSEVHSNPSMNPHLVTNWKYHWIYHMNLSHESITWIYHKNSEYHWIYHISFLNMTCVYRPSSFSAICYLVSVLPPHFTLNKHSCFFNLSTSCIFLCQEPLFIQ